VTHRVIHLTVAFIAGIAAYKFFPFFPVSIITFVVLASYALLFKALPDKKRAVILILVVLFGFFYSFLRHADLPGIASLQSGPYQGKVSIEGTVTGVPEKAEENIRFTIESVEIDGGRVAGKVRLVLDAHSIDNTSLVSLLRSGDRIGAFSRLKTPVMLRNPGVFSYDYKKDGVVAFGYINKVTVIHRDQGIINLLDMKRQELGGILSSSFSRESAALLRALIPGLKTGINREMRDSFSSTGLAHLLSISGTHFGLLAFLIFKFIKTTVKFLPVRLFSRMTQYISPTQIASVVTLPVLVMYALISGASTPTVRALVMVFIYMSALFMGRKDNWLNSLSIAAIFILLYRPDTLFGLSFQLSFIAVLSIGLVLESRSKTRDQYHEETDTGWNPAYAKIAKKLLVKIKTVLSITIAAILGTAPIIALIFKQFPLISPLSNLVVTPLVCFFILPAGFISGFSALFFNMTTVPFNGLTETVTNFTLNLVHAMSSIPYSNLRVHDPSFLIITAYYGLLFFAFKSRVKWRFFPLMAVLFIYTAVPLLYAHERFNVTFLDVGQGESSVVELPDKKIMLIDGSTNRPDMGRMVIAPYLWSRGIRKIDVMVLSHPHPDHFGGLIYILDNFIVKDIWSNGRMTHDARVFYEKIIEKNVRYKALKRGDILDADGYKITVFHPYEEFSAGSSRGNFSDENSDSLVMKIESGDVSFLFTGDIEEEAEENLLHLGSLLKSDILKVPHHGGRKSSIREFIESVRPEIAVVSVGMNNPFHHPHEETLERYRDSGATLYRTDRHGAITISNNNTSYEIETFNDNRLKPVQTFSDEIRNLGLLL
jgi:competence protein ComEC